MLRFHDIAITLRPAAADLPVVPAAEALHRKTVFQDIFAECFYDLLQLRLEGTVFDLPYSFRVVWKAG